MGQLVLVPLHVSATSHGPADARQVVPLLTGPQVPSAAAPAFLLQAWQSLVPPVQGLSQQTLSTQ